MGECMDTLTKGGVDRASALSLCSDDLTTRTATPEVAELESRPKWLPNWTLHA